VKINFFVPACLRVAASAKARQIARISQITKFLIQKRNLRDQRDLREENIPIAAHHFDQR
jgi:hypothetical protein